MAKLVLYIHGQGGKASEAEHYTTLFPDYEITGLNYKAENPWEAKEEFPLLVKPLCQKFESVILIANSIGAFYALHALSNINFERAFLISPIVDMERLILNMMARAGITESELQDKKEISTSFGEILSWDYLQYIRKYPLNPVNWKTPTEILYGENDNLTSYETINDFAKRLPAGLTVMKNGEHYFHTDEQMKFLDSWIRKFEDTL